jgi:hypothetical protein
MTSTSGVTLISAFRPPRFEPTSIAMAELPLRRTLDSDRRRYAVFLMK